MNLADLGLSKGEAVRFRRRADGRWHPAKVVRVERDGSIGLTDRDGKAAAIPVQQVEVAATGPRGGVGWEPLAARVARAEQRSLF